MTPGRYDLTLYRGDSKRWRFRLWADEEQSDPIDLTGITVAAQWRDRPGGTRVVSFDCTVTLPNEVAMTLTAAMWETAPNGGKWDMQLTYGDGGVSTVLAGPVTVTADITDLSMA